MWKLSRRGGQARPASRGTGAAAAALVLIGALTIPASVTLACDDDYPQPVGYVPYPQPGPTVVVVDPRDDGRYEHRWRERAARRYWYWRGREQGRDHRHHHRGWD